MSSFIQDSSSLEKGTLSTVTHITRQGSEYIQLGDNIFDKAELQAALAPEYKTRTSTKLGNPTPLGLASFSICCLVLSLINANVRGVHNNHVLAGGCLFFAGCIELFAGLLCMVVGDTYGCTVFGAFGGFWLSYGAIITDAFGIVSSYKTDEEFGNAIGFFLSAWFVFTFIVLLCTAKAVWSLFSLIFFLDMTFLMLAIGSFIGNNKVSEAGGYFGILSAVSGFYTLYVTLANKENCYLPVYPLAMPNSV